MQNFRKIYENEGVLSVRFDTPYDFRGSRHATCASHGAAKSGASSIRMVMSADRVHCLHCNISADSSEMSAMFSTSRSSQGGSSSGNLVEFKVDLISTKTKS
ncbi:hypothetical protein Y032_0158g3256 [Ancylostoma ceylanicum]|uniref:Uncharacterized protein n=1 Tax=Ancylostoma ceylanicum TaxID=53326 RepID=A0A016SYR4_9BILA|nr:hypothetical protein Y032_0158g3256 [Ancylostoma ceylanicum]